MLAVWGIGNNRRCQSLLGRLLVIARSRHQKPPVPALGNPAIHLAPIPAVHPPSLAAVSRPGVGVGNPVAVPGSVFESALAVSRVATDSMGNWMGRGDRLLSRS